MMVASDEAQRRSVYRQEPKIVITEWGYSRFDNNVNGSKDVSKPGVRSYCIIGTAVMNIEGVELPDVAKDWDLTNAYLKKAQKEVWEFVASQTTALAIVESLNPKSQAQFKLVQHYALAKQDNPALMFSDFLFEKSKYTNIMQKANDNEHIFKLTAPIQIWVPKEEQGKFSKANSSNPAMKAISTKLKYNEIEFFFNNEVRA